MGRLTETEKRTNAETKKSNVLFEAGHSSAEISQQPNQMYGAISTTTTRINVQFRAPDLRRNSIHESNETDYA